MLVCADGRESGYADCVEADDPAVYDAVTLWLHGCGVFWSRVHIAEANCLDLCSAGGAAVAVHPRNQWYLDIRPDDISALLAKMFGPDTSNLGARPHD